DLVVVERDVLVDGVRVLHEAVVRDDGRAVVLGVLELGPELRAVDRADDDDLRALLDHGVDLALLLRDTAVGELDDRLEAGLREPVVEQLLGEDPVLRRLLRERDTDGRALLEAGGRGLAAGRLTATGVAAAVGRAAAEHERTRGGQRQERRGELLHGYHFLVGHPSSDAVVGSYGWWVGRARQPLAAVAPASTGTSGWTSSAPVTAPVPLSRRDGKMRPMIDGRPCTLL